MHLWQTYHAPATLEEALALLAEAGERARIMAGGTDLMIELDRGARQLEAVIDITRIPDLDGVSEEAGHFRLGPLVTHNQAANHVGIIARALPLAQAAWEVGAPQLRNRGTVAGNLVTASPANDTITALMALDATVTLRDTSGERTLPLADFYEGFRRTALRPTEIVVAITFPAFSPVARGAFYKLALRRSQAISVVNVAIVLAGDEGADPTHPFGNGGRVQSARIALGSVAPTIIRAPAAEALLVGEALTDRQINSVAEATAEAATPIDDVRGPAIYRRQMVRTITARLLRSLRDGREGESFPTERANLWQGWGHPTSPIPAYHFGDESEQAIESTVNGQPVAWWGATGKSLLRALREEGAMIGTKEGCAEGECGACTVLLDGAAVVSCLVPAERAHGATLATIEGLAEGETLHPIQQAFVEHDAVQCGYCTPGFVMSTAALLQENANPTEDQLRQAISGNLCRCTGYYKILDAMRAAAQAARAGERAG